MKFLAILLLVMVLLCSCESSKTQTNSNSEQANSNKSDNVNTNTNKNKEVNSNKSTSSINNELKKAIEDYINKHFSEWKIKGIENFADCETPCRINLVKDKTDKVILLVGREFEDKDSKKYWLVFEADKFDLAQQKLTDQEEEWKSTFLENLS